MSAELYWQQVCAQTKPPVMKFMPHLVAIACSALEALCCCLCCVLKQTAAGLLVMRALPSR